MSKIAIRGDKKRGADVIKKLESLGGVNQFIYNSDFGYDPDFFYYLTTNKLIRAIEVFDVDLNEFDVYNIEEFD